MGDTSNFGFLKGEWAELEETARRVERAALNDARTACFYARRALELAVHWMYQSDDALTEPYDDSLSARLHEPTFRSAVPREVWFKMRLLKDLGNEAVHSRRKFGPDDGAAAARELFHVLYYLARTYAPNGAATLSGLQFDPAALTAEIVAAAQTAAQLAALQNQLSDRDRALRETEKSLREREATDTTARATVAQLDAEIARLKSEVAAAKQANSVVPDTHDYSEAETRDRFIDLLLREAGWPLKNKEDREYPVAGMPNEKGKGFVDYVLWGDDGLPLAVIEAKRTKKDAHIGKRQAELYADCLETAFGRRPLIFFTNGYDHFFWDDTRYPPRPVQGFFRKEELERLIQRRASQKPLASEKIDKIIVERSYQANGIRAVAAQFEEKKQRKALIVMATGSGKTRVAIALSDLMMRANWVKRVLFLADRVALVRQAHNAFKRHLPGVASVNLVTEDADAGSRICLSTYPTMMNLIDEEDADGTRRFGPGHFDLVIIDEAHRSIYQKYGAIFGYFDSLLVGLTATPKAEVDKNTYRLFELENGVPTFAYELEEGVADGVLVPPKLIEVPLKFQREGIAYDDLPDDEKEQWESLEWGEEGPPDRVEPAAVNRWLFNRDTVDKVLVHLMTHGLKVDGGDRLGKTILFAKNHNHARFIEERFNANYPHLAGKFARVIDNYEPYAQSLLDDFSTPDKNPHLAISVDMLDTGIDVPEIVNLVFFKMVHSRTKFWQMIGRGTRLSPDLFGPGDDKAFFTCFDFCGNFEFFRANALGVEGGSQDSLGRKLFLKRMELLQNLRGQTVKTPAPKVIERAAGYGDTEILGGEVADALHREVAAMNLNNFLVRPARKWVETYAQREAWETLTPTTAAEVGDALAGLPAELDPEDITARQFDLLLLQLELSLLNVTVSLPRYIGLVKETAGLLEEKASIPLVAAQMPLIAEVQTDEFWQDATLLQIENVRKRLRDLVKFLDRAGQNILYTDFEDEKWDPLEVTIPALAVSIDVGAYRAKVTHYLKTHLDDPAVQKIRNAQPLNDRDLRSLERALYALGGDGGASLFESIRQEKTLTAFVRSLVGLDRKAALSAFSAFLNDSLYNANQIEFIHRIIGFLTQNGTLDPGALYESPFTDFNPNGLDGIFPGKEAEIIVGIVNGLNGDAAPAGT